MRMVLHLLFRKGASRLWTKTSIDCEFNQPFHKKFSVSLCPLIAFATSSRIYIESIKALVGSFCTMGWQPFSEKDAWGRHIYCLIVERGSQRRTGRWKGPKEKSKQELWGEQGLSGKDTYSGLFRQENEWCEQKTLERKPVQGMKSGFDAGDKMEGLRPWIAASC